MPVGDCHMDWMSPMGDSIVSLSSSSAVDIASASSSSSARGISVTMSPTLTVTVPSLACLHTVARGFNQLSVAYCS